ncbi:hypothetical protein Bca4012_026130 [Brassica carinata]|uniref:Uncharacterized protein n=1 Tax=Brassica carinata TaxID=52824 RepID=A0A8X7VHG7_BRACI|nr:hypothetical protein Bca52824_023230 [Brassica carinata]
MAEWWQAWVSVLFSASRKNESYQNSPWVLWRLVYLKGVLSQWFWHVLVLPVVARRGSGCWGVGEVVYGLSELSMFLVMSRAVVTGSVSCLQEFYVPPVFGGSIGQDRGGLLCLFSFGLGYT